MDNFLQHTIPVADWVENFTDWLTGTFSGLFSALQSFGQFIMDAITNVLLFVPPLLMIVLLTAAAFSFHAKIRLASLYFVGLLFIYNQGLWTDLMNTVTLVLLSSLVSIIIGIPLGILMAKSEKAQSIVTPILDFMQTMPGFVYLIPAVAFFGIGWFQGLRLSDLCSTTNRSDDELRDSPNFS